MPQQGQEKGTPQRRREFIEELRRLGPGAECVYWRWSTKRKGYVHIHVDGEQVHVHRWVYEQIIGPLPPQTGPGATGTVVMHSCDNPPCVRPSHLSAGRMASGESNGRAKLTQSDVGYIRSLASLGFPQMDLAQVFGVSQSQISRIVKGESW
jgi:hypothetical protein